ncbi:Rv1733c family protein [Rhodococcus gordoniae]|uniref:Rv1733c family protein n=1 Tax=Rhodococcus gordoniae TaxID=223392 RepID=UPI0020CDB457|nr:hypothetical protein [Rhodococcus gordoniae]UTT46810.1 hypothetical protein NMQ04_10765 [Rhodococcus gordoniae]
MIRGDTAAVRWWRLRPWSANPLMRGSDRLEAVAVVLLVAIMLLLVPVAGVIGTDSYAQLTERSHQQAIEERQVPAIVLDDDPDDVAVRDPMAEYSSRLEPVLARWEVEGVEHTGLVGLDSRGETGETVRIRVDEKGDYIPASRTGTENAIAALGAALAFLILETVGYVLTLLGIHGVVNRHRISQWHREWQDTRRLPGWPIG